MVEYMPSFRRDAVSRLESSFVTAQEFKRPEAAVDANPQARIDRSSTTHTAVAAAVTNDVRPQLAIPTLRINVSQRGSECNERSNGEAFNSVRPESRRSYACSNHWKASSTSLRAA